MGVLSYERGALQRKGVLLGGRGTFPGRGRAPRERECFPEKWGELREKKVLLKVYCPGEKGVLIWGRDAL